MSCLRWFVLVLALLAAPLGAQEPEDFTRGVEAYRRGDYAEARAPFWWVFWIVHLLIGTFLPLAILLKTQSPKWLGAAGLLIATTFMAVRLNIVIPALVTPEIEGLQRSFQDRRLTFSYMPTVHEWLVFVFIVCLGIAFFVVANRVLGNRIALSIAEPNEVSS